MKFIRIIAALLFTCNVANAQFSPGFPSSGSAGVSSISTACGATSTGGPSTGAVTVSSLETPSTVTSGNYSTSNCGNVVYYNSASDQTPTIPLAATAGLGAAFKTCSVQHSQTVTASGSDNIGATGAATTIPLPLGTSISPSCIEFTSDGTSRWTPLVYGGSGSGITALTGDVTASGSGSVAATVAAIGGSPVSSPTGGTIQLGAADAATSVAQILRAQSVVGGTSNTAGTNLTVDGSVGTGTGAGGTIIFQTAPAGSTGTSQNALVNDLQINSAGNVAFVSNMSGANNSFELYDTYARAQSRTTTGRNAIYDATHAEMSSTGTFGISAQAIGNNGDVVANTDTQWTRGGVATWQSGKADAAAPVAQTLKAQSVITGTSNTSGANWTFDASNSTGTGVGGKLILQTTVTGSTGSTPNSQFPMLSLNPGSATTSTLQLGDGTNITTYDSCTALTTGATGVVACTASAMRFKNILGSLSEDEASHGLDQLHAGEWVYKDQYQTQFGGGAEHVSLYADDVARMDPRCVTRDGDGQIHDYWDRCVIAYLVADRQKMKAEIVSLQQKVR